MPLSVSFYVRVFLTGKNKKFSSRACIYALHLLNMCKDIFEPAEKCFLQQLETETRRERNEIWIHEGARADASVLPVPEVFAKTANFPKCKISLYGFVWPGTDIEKE